MESKLFPFMLELELLLNKYKFTMEAGPDFVEVTTEDGKNHAIYADASDGTVKLSYEGPGFYGNKDL